jgi:hypothetical protein
VPNGTGHRGEGLGGGRPHAFSRILYLVQYPAQVRARYCIEDSTPAAPAAGTQGWGTVSHPIPGQPQVDHGGGPGLGSGYCAPCIMHNHAPPHGPLAHFPKFEFGIPCHGIQGSWGSPHFCIVERKGQQTWPPFPSSYPVFSTALPQNIDNYLPELRKSPKFHIFKFFGKKNLCFHQTMHPPFGFEISHVLV